MLPLSSVDTRRGWGRHTVATDASDAGFGVCETEATEEAAAIGRVAERRRFKTAGHQVARAAALTVGAPPCPLQQNVTSMRPLREPGGASRVSQVPRSLLAFDRWVACFARSWRFRENVLLTEARVCHGYAAPPEAAGRNR